ncbi:MAG: class I SAM-dependent methyltransferase, partial [Thermoplasmata archaeon]
MKDASPLGTVGARRIAASQRLYHSHAEVYDQIYSWKDYEKDARRVHAIAERYRRSAGKKLLDVACGTGHHIETLRRWYDCVGVDLSSEMLSIARRRLPEIRFVRGDMRDLHLSDRFDIVTCLFSAIGYLRTYEALRRAIRTMVEHLKPGGVLLVEPFLRPGEWRSPSVHLQTYRSDDIVIARVSRSTKRAPNIAIIDDHFMVGRSRRPVERFESHHELAMFEPRPTLAIFRDAGVSVRYLSRGLMPGRGLYVGVRPSSR